MPDDMAVTAPECETVAREVLLLLQVPPVVASVNVVIAPGQTADVPPDIAAIDGEETVIVKVAILVPQVFVTVYLITDVPAATPLTTPPLVIVATDVVVLLQTPPLVASLSVVVVPIHIFEVPVIVPEYGLTEIEYVAIAVPQLLVTE